MNGSKLSKIFGAGVLAASLAVVPMSRPAAAQYAEPGIENPTIEYERENDFEWGWLGLLGLLGLAGLAGKKRRTEHTVYADPAREREDYATRSTYR